MPTPNPLCSTCRWLDVEGGNLCKAKLPQREGGHDHAGWLSVKDPEHTKGCIRYEPPKPAPSP